MSDLTEWNQLHWGSFPKFWCHLYSLAPGKSECDSKNRIFNLVLLIGIFRSSHDNNFQWMPQDLTDDKSILVQVMAWCRQATSHCLSQCWLSLLSPYGVARPQWVNSLNPVNIKQQITCYNDSLMNMPWINIKVIDMEPMLAMVCLLGTLVEIIWHIEAETKLPPFSRRHFQRHFLEWKCMNYDKDFNKTCSPGSS